MSPKRDPGMRQIPSCITSYVVYGALEAEAFSNKFRRQGKQYLFFPLPVFYYKTSKKDTLPRSALVTASFPLSFCAFCGGSSFLELVWDFVQSFLDALLLNALLLNALLQNALVAAPEHIKQPRNREQAAENHSWF